MRVISTDGMTASCAYADRVETVSLALIGAVAPDDYVLVHLGTAFRQLSADEARQIEDPVEAVEAAANGKAFDHLLRDLIDLEPQLPPHLQKSVHTRKKREACRRKFTGKGYL